MNVALFNVSAVIEIPFLQVTADARMNRRLVPGLRGARQDQMLSGCTGLRCYHRDGRYGLFQRPLRDFRFVTAPLQYSEGCDGDCGNDGNHADPSQVARRRFGLSAAIVKSHQLLRSAG